MRILLIGATGLIGSSIAARLTAEGHEVIGLTRNVDAAARRVALSRWVQMDLRDATAPDRWARHLSGVEAVVNCAGTLQDSVRDSTARVHDEAPAALWEECERAGVRHRRHH